ncbi:hypothetical protein QOZ80_4AG0326110 [Eleusine coracana subsp. coracana]|nr:hypothetical protein QOZ80_4AG0326110 [Eleusine coracana subsp. coracana]
MTRVSDMNPQKQGALLDRMLSYIHHVLPNLPVSVDGDLCILFDDDGGGVDRLSRLPDALHSNIVSRLPVKDAARTAVLSRRWHPVWRSSPLILVDAHLLPEIPKHVEHADSNTVVAVVSSILAVHPGPIRCVHLTCCYMNEFPGEVARWLQHLAVKGAQELFLINRPWPLADITKHMPATIVSMAALTRLYLCSLNTTRLPRGAAFPCLCELGLCCIVIEPRDIEFVLAKSPVLDALYFQGHLVPSLRLRLVSQSLRCVQIHGSNLESVTMVDTPRLERLIVSNSLESNIKIKIGRAPALQVFGFFELGKDVLEIGNTVIKAGTPVKPSTMVATVKVLALSVQFGAAWLPQIVSQPRDAACSYETSVKTTESTGRLNLKFWQEAGAIECVQSHINMMAFHDFRGDRSELAFLKFIIESAQKLKVLVVEFANGCVSSETEVKSQVEALFAGKRGSSSGGCSVLVLENRLSEGTDCWDFERGSEDDPFALFKCKRGCQFSV